MEHPELLEAQAYANGDLERAALYAEIADLRKQVEELEENLDTARDDSLEAWERNHGPAGSYRQFFYDCFENLGAHYPCPSIGSDHDQSVIFDAIRMGEEARESQEEGQV